jgi:hypothetical protein
MLIVIAMSFNIPLEERKENPERSCWNWRSYKILEASMKKRSLSGLILVIVLSSILSACGATNSTPANNAGADNSANNTSSENTSQGGPGGQPPTGSPGGGGPGSNTVDTASRVTDVAATITKGSTSDTSACSNGNSTAQVACLSQAFAKTLSDKETQSLKYDLTSQNAAVWSNLPTGAVKRNGLMLGSLSAKSLEAFKALAAVALGESGYDTLKSIIMADEYLGTDTGNKMWDADLYYIAFLGEPSATSPWILQIGGHHFATNLTYNTKTASATPMFVGVEPQSFTKDGVTYAPLATRHDAMYNMIQSLSVTELASAKLKKTFDDVLLGPGQDGKFPASEGILVSSLSTDQKALVKTAIEAWVKDTNPDISQDMLTAYLSEDALNKTSIAWSGSTNSSDNGSYIRIDGPRVWIEFVCQTGVAYKNKIHFHTVWRDKVADYGGSFSG